LIAIYANICAAPSERTPERRERERGAQKGEA
jgi:hypothetical protein